MTNSTIEQTFPLFILDDEQIQNNVYLGDVAKNIEIFKALLNGKDVINALLPNHFEKLNKCCNGISAILECDEIRIFTFEKEIRTGFPFLMLDKYPNDDTYISNRMNYSNGKLSHIEASMALNALSYCYLCETTENEDEAVFSAFMLDFLKILASHNYKTEGFNSSAFYSLID